MKHVKIAIIGTAEWEDKELVRKVVRFLLKSNSDFLLISGAGGNVDITAEQEQKKLKGAYCIFPAQWDLYGKAAGHRRNPFIAQFADHGIAFWDEVSSGTGATVRMLKESPYKEVLIIRPDMDYATVEAKIREFAKKVFQ
jgi:hypothetical protein